MRRRRLLPLLVASGLLLSGCAVGVPRALESPEPTTPSPTASATSASAGEVVLALDSISYAHDGTTEVVSLENGDEILDLLQRLTGVMPEGIDLEGPEPAYDWAATSYDWGVLEIIVSNDDRRVTNVSVRTPELDGVPIRTAEGLAVGSTRAELEAANAAGVWDEDGDGIDDQLSAGARAVQGTESLADPGAVGAEYFVFVMGGDTVTEISFPGNDYSDI